MGVGEAGQPVLRGAVVLNVATTVPTNTRTYQGDARSINQRFVYSFLFLNLDNMDQAKISETQSVLMQLNLCYLI